MGKIIYYDEYTDRTDLSAMQKSRLRRPEHFKEYIRNWSDKNIDKERVHENTRVKKLKEHNPRKYLYKRSKGSAKHRGIEFSIEVEDIIIPEKCPIILQEFNWNSKIHAAPNTPSLDRIDNTKGYIKGNVRVISYKANTLKRNATLEEIERLYQYSKGII